MLGVKMPLTGDCEAIMEVGFRLILEIHATSEKRLSVSRRGHCGVAGQGKDEAVGEPRSGIRQIRALQGLPTENVAGVVVHAFLVNLVSDGGNHSFTLSAKDKFCPVKSNITPASARRMQSGR